MTETVLAVLAVWAAAAVPVAARAQRVATNRTGLRIATMLTVPRLDLRNPVTLHADKSEQTTNCMQDAKSLPFLIACEFFHSKSSNGVYKPYL